MNSGDLSREYALGREIRSAYYLGKAGWTLQQRSRQKFVYSRSLYKLLANLIWDWHRLSANEVNDFRPYPFHGIGDLVWVPHLFGGLGMAQPTLYDASSNEFRLQDGLFASLAQLGQCKMYRLYGFNDMKPDAQGRMRLYFADAGYSLDRKARVDDAERHYWAKLLDIYCELTVDDLNALATCRTAGATLLSLRAQLVRWHKNVTKALTSFSEGDATDKVISAYRKSSLECADQFNEKLKLWANIGRARQSAIDAASNTELRGLVPAIADVPAFGGADAKVSVLRRYADCVAALQYLFLQVDALWRGETVSTDAVETKLRIVDSAVGTSNLCEPSAWNSLFLAKETRRVASLCRSLADAAIAEIASAAEITIPRQKEFYEAVAGPDYPLPREHFLPGF